MDVSPRPACSSFHSQSGSCSSPVLIILSDTVSPSLCLPRHLSIYSRNFYYSVTIAWDNASTRPLNHHHPLHPFSFNGIYLNFKRPNLILPVLLPFQFVSLLSYSLRLMKSSCHIGWKKGHAIFPIRIPTVLSFNAIARRFLFFFFDIFTWLTNFPEIVHCSAKNRKDFYDNAEWAYMQECSR